MSLLAHMPVLYRPRMTLPMPTPRRCLHLIALSPVSYTHLTLPTIYSV